MTGKDLTTIREEMRLTPHELAQLTGYREARILAMEAGKRTIPLYFVKHILAEKHLRDVQLTLQALLTYLKDKPTGPFV